MMIGMLYMQHRDQQCLMLQYNVTDDVPSRVNILDSILYKGNIGYREK